MAAWLTELNRFSEARLPETRALEAYAKLHLGFLHIHPFWDGNGRLARVLSNIPVLRSGHLPVVINVRDRKRYIDILARVELETGQLTPETGVRPDGATTSAFCTFCQRAYQTMRDLIEQARAQTRSYPQMNADERRFSQINLHICGNLCESAV